MPHQPRSTTAAMKTIGQTALLFADDRDAARRFLDDWPDSGVIYEGAVAEIPEQLARSFAPLHPRWHSYYADAMGILYQGKGAFTHGTECPLKAIHSYAARAGRQPVGKSHFPFVLIWHPLVPESVSEET